MSRELTQKQQAVLAVIRAGILAGKPPTVREIGREIGVLSSCTVQRHLDALEKKGRIRRGRRYAYRGLELTDASADAADVRRALLQLAAEVAAAPMSSLPGPVAEQLQWLYDLGFDPEAQAQALIEESA